MLVALLLAWCPSSPGRGTPLAQAAARSWRCRRLVAAAVAGVAVGLGRPQPVPRRSSSSSPRWPWSPTCRRPSPSAPGQAVSTRPAATSRTSASAMILIGFLASSAYDQSAKVTLDQGEPQQVGDLKLTFTRLIPRHGDARRSAWRCAVVQAGRQRATTPTRSCSSTSAPAADGEPAHPHLRHCRTSTSRRSSTIPAAAPARRSRSSWPRARARRSAATRSRFAGFDLQRRGNALAADGDGEPVTVGAELRRHRRRRRRSTVMPTLPLHRAGRGAARRRSTCRAAAGRDRRHQRQRGRGPARLRRARRRPTGGRRRRCRSTSPTSRSIQLVWYGLYVILARRPAGDLPAACARRAAHDDAA